MARFHTFKASREGKLYQILDELNNEQDEQSTEEEKTEESESDAEEGE